MLLYSVKELPGHPPGQQRGQVQPVHPDAAEAVHVCAEQVLRGWRRLCDDARAAARGPPLPAGAERKNEHMAVRAEERDQQESQFHCGIQAHPR